MNKPDELFYKVWYQLSKFTYRCEWHCNEQTWWTIL